MTRTPAFARATLCTIGALLPLLWSAMGCEAVLSWTGDVALIEPAALQQLLLEKTPVTLIDVRDRQDVAAGHIAGAQAVLVSELDGYLQKAGPPRDRILVTVCYKGVRSIEAAVIARSHGYRQVCSLAGGMLAWQQRGLAVQTGGLPPVAPEIAAPPVVQVAPFAQFISVLGGFGFKPAYTLLSLLLVIWLWRTRDPGLRLIRNAMLLFFVGENACASNFLFLGGHSDGFELAHGAGMIGMSAFLPWGLLRLFDDHVLQLSVPQARCALQRLCGHCWKQQPVACFVHRMFRLVAPALALIALIPLTAPLQTINDVLLIYGTPVAHPYSFAIHVAEFRIYPLLAAALLLWTGIRLCSGGPAVLPRVQRAFFVGFGFMAFALLRFFLINAFGSQLWWADFWEELTELTTIASVAWLLWLLRRPLRLPTLRKKEDAHGPERLGTTDADPDSPQPAAGA